MNGQRASGAALATGSINGLGVIRVSGNDVFIGGPTMSKQERARAAAIARIVAAEESLMRWNADDRAQFKKWFGDDNEAARLAMLLNLERMRRKLSGAEVKIGDMDVYAHVNPYSDGNTVMVDQKFWRTPEDDGGTSERDTESGALIHETSHFVDTAWTGDHAYGHDACEALAREHPGKAQDNADSIEYFCEETPM